MRRQWYWPQAHNDVIQKLLREACKGTRVVLIPGNHDEFARKYLGHNFGGVDLMQDCIHETADGGKLWAGTVTCSTASSSVPSGWPMSATGSTT